MLHYFFVFQMFWFFLKQSEVVELTWMEMLWPAWIFLCCLLLTWILCIGIIASEFLMNCMNDREE